MTKQKKYTFTISIIAFLMVAATLGYFIFAWFFTNRRELIVIIGDANISVKGWFRVASLDELDENNVLVFEDEHELDESFNEVKGLSSNQFVAFKFEINNLSDRASTISFRFSPFSDAIFDNFIKYYSAGGVVNSSLENDISQSAKSNTAKLAFSLADIAYVYEDNNGGIVIDTDYISTNSLWQFSSGEYIFEDIPILGQKNGNYKPVYLYFRFVKNQSSILIEDYKKWLCGYNDISGNTIGYGQERCALLRNSTFSALSIGDKNLVDSYLAKYIDSEIKSINTDDSSDAPSELNLDLKYFEIIGKNGSI